MIHSSSFSLALHTYQSPLPQEKKMPHFVYSHLPRVNLAYDLYMNAFMSIKTCLLVGVSQLNTIKISNLEVNIIYSLLHPLISHSSFALVHFVLSH